MPSISTTVSPRNDTTAAARRRRSSPTHALHSSGSNSALAYPVPESIAWLEQLSLAVTLSADPKLKPRDAKFVLSVNHAKGKVTWTHARSFDEYRGFQHRLHKALRHGHFCHAECPWLYTFVKSYFPKSYVIGSLIAPKQVMYTRREALERFLQTLQTFLLNRNNHSCSVLTSAVATEVLAFINGDEGKAHQCRLAPKASSECAAILAAMGPSTSSRSLTRQSWDSEASLRAVPDELDDSDAPPSSTGSDDDDICRICHTHLADEATAPTNTRHPTPTSSDSSESPVHAQLSPVPTLAVPATLPPRAPSATARRASSHSRPHFYTTQLACGHRFHDECIVPKLNETMSCPVCGREERRKQ